MASRLPLNWQEFYREAIIDILSNIGLDVNPDRIRNGEDVLLKYNTRVNPREHEVDSNTIFSELFSRWGIDDPRKIKTGKDTFASFFMKHSELYSDSVTLLRELKKMGLKIGVLTNVAYGMDKEYMIRDIAEMSQYIDIFLTSTEIGFRKPNTRGYHELAKKLGINVTECMFVGDEEVDIEGANASGMVSVLIDRDGHNNQYGQVYTVRTLCDILELI